MWRIRMPNVITFGSIMPKADLLPEWERVLSAAAHLQIQLANPLPFDLEETKLAEYKNLAPKWHRWTTVKNACAHCATMMFDRASEKRPKRRKRKP